MYDFNQTPHQTPNNWNKPPDLVRRYPPTQTITNKANLKKFVAVEKQKIQDQLRPFGLTIQTATLHDISRIKALLDQVYAAEFRHYREYSLYETIAYGATSVVLENLEDGTLAGISLSAGYGDADRTLFTSFTVVLPAFNGHNFGVSLSLFVSLLGLENGLRVKRCTANPRNIPTLINLLNYVGYFIDGFHKDLYVEGLHQFSLSLPLTPKALFNHTIDWSKLLAFIEAKTPHEDYQLIFCEDLDSIEAMYETTNFKIIAILPEKYTGKPHQFFAVPISA